MFIDNSKFDFVNVLEANWEIIRGEYEALPQKTFHPWVQSQMYDGSGWRVYGLYADRQLFSGAEKQCPETAKLISSIPGLSIAGFSRLGPGAHIKPHVGWAKSVYRLHLGLIVPAGCELRVGSETRAWHEGRCLIFDDTVEHEAWNNSNTMRGTLLLDFARPGYKGEISDCIPEEVQEFSQGLRDNSQELNKI